MGLFTPAWKSKNGRRALRAVEKITEQKKLAQIAKEAESWEARKAAVGKLTDQNLLADIAKNVGESHIRIKAIEKLDNKYLDDLLEEYIIRLSGINWFYYMEEILLICSRPSVFTKTKWMRISSVIKATWHFDSHGDSIPEIRDYHPYYGAPYEEIYEKFHEDTPHKDINAKKYLAKFPPYIDD